MYVREDHKVDDREQQLDNLFSTDLEKMSCHSNVSVRPPFLRTVQYSNAVDEQSAQNPDMSLGNIWQNYRRFHSTAYSPTCLTTQHRNRKYCTEQFLINH